MAFEIPEMFGVPWPWNGIYIVSAVLITVALVVFLPSFCLPLNIIMGLIAAAIITPTMWGLLELYKALAIVWKFLVSLYTRFFPSRKTELPIAKPNPPPAPLIPLGKAPPEDRTEEILDELCKEPAITGSEIARRLKYSRQSVFYHLDKLVKEGIIIRHEPTETNKGIEIFFEPDEPDRNESGFHKVLVKMVQSDLEGMDMSGIAGGPNQPDIVLNEIAIEVETGMKPELGGFRKQVEKRFAQGYKKVVVVVINKKQKARYEKALVGMKRVKIVEPTGLEGVL